MQNLCCGSCKNELNEDMEIEHSQFLSEYFCNPSCAQNRYFDYVQSNPIDLTDKDDIEKRGLKIINGKLTKK